MGFKRFVCLLVMLIISTIVCSSDAYKFNVGGKDGWVLNPSENYNHWAERMRFLVNDTLFFKYKKGSDSVLLVSRDDYDKCNTDEPIVKMDGGDSVFKFDRSGPFYFISGNKANCDKAQKLIILVLAVRNRPPSPPSMGPTPPQGSTPSPSPTAVTPTPIAPSPAATPELSPMSPSPASGAPVPTPALSPMSPSPASGAPVPTPALSPISPSPASGAPVPTPAPPVSSPPSPQTPISPTPSTTLSPPVGTPPTSGNTPPGGANSTAPAGSSANSCTPSVVLVSMVLFVSSGVLVGSFKSP